MKRIIGALKARLSRPKASVVDDQSSRTVSADEVSMPDIYRDEHDVTVPHLRVIDQPTLEDGESAGINPYDTAKMQKE